MKKYKVGFSLKGLIAFLIIMFPNIFWMIVPPTNNFLSTNSSNIEALNIIMTVSQWAMVALLIFIVRKTVCPAKNFIYKLICLLCIGIYYLFWTLYYLNKTSPIIFIGMAVFTCAFFILFILWQKNYPALIPAIIFSLFHIAITVSNAI